MASIPSDDSRRAGSVARILAAALTGATLGSLANALWAVSTHSSTRVRDHLELFVMARRILALAGYEILRAAPVALSNPLDVANADELATFFGQSVLTGLGLSFPWAVVAALFLPFLCRSTTTPWLETAVGVAFFCPVLYAPIRALAPTIPGIPVPNAVVFVLVCAALGGTGFTLFRRVPPPRFATRGAAVAAVLTLALAVTVVAARPGNLAPVRTSHASDSRPPNVLLVSIDSLRADHLGSYGYGRATSPAIDRLAREGARFVHAVAPSSWTLPSHLSLLSGLPIERRHEDPAGVRLGSDSITLAEVLKGAGYRTGGFVGGPYVETRYGLGQGFETYDDFTVVSRSNAESHRGITSPELLRLATRWLESWRRSGAKQPFFLFWHLWDVHFDYAPPPPYDRMFDPDYEGTVTGRDFLANPAIHRDMEPRDLAHVVSLYDGEIAFTDAHIGLLIDRLEDWGILDDTLIVVTSDHGDEFFEHGAKGHRNNLYDTTLRVPLVVRWPPRVGGGRVVRTQARLMDVAPTILSLAGIAAPEEFGFVSSLDRREARDLSPFLTAPPTAEDDPAGDPPAFADLHGESGCLRTVRWKLIQAFPSGGSPGAPELYDLAADPGEKTNLAAIHFDVSRNLGRRLWDWRQRFGLRGLLREANPDEEHLELLRSLGYVD